MIRERRRGEWNDKRAARIAAERERHRKANLSAYARYFDAILPLPHDLQVSPWSLVRAVDRVPAKPLPFLVSPRFGKDAHLYRGGKDAHALLDTPPYARRHLLPVDSDSLPPLSSGTRGTSLRSPASGSEGLPERELAETDRRLLIRPLTQAEGQWIHRTMDRLRGVVTRIDL